MSLIKQLQIFFLQMSSVCTLLHIISLTALYTLLLLFDTVFFLRFSLLIVYILSRIFGSYALIYAIAPIKFDNFSDRTYHALLKSLTSALRKRNGGDDSATVVDMRIANEGIVYATSTLSHSCFSDVKQFEEKKKIDSWLKATSSILPSISEIGDENEGDRCQNEHHDKEIEQASGLAEAWQD